MSRQKYQNIPTNIITGFLGVGKTTAIRHLLQSKPEGEKWAVLVNEFGEVGIDGALLNADGIAVKEVPGGCMCCAVGVPSRVALNHLIREQNPDRLLIEPTGLAHPKQVLEQFSGEAYKGVLDIRAVVCLVDPWCTSDPQFMSLPAFRDQVTMADVLVATKADVAQAKHLQQFWAFAGQLSPPKAKVAEVALGKVDWQWLDIARGLPGEAPAVVEHHHHENDTTVETSQASFDSEGVMRVESAAEFGFSCGWRFSGDWCFDAGKLTALFEALAVPRVKGVFRTREGWLIVNKMRDTVSREWIDSAEESRVEMIHLEAVDWLAIDRQLRACH